METKLALRGGRIFTGNGFLEKGTVLINSNTIEAVINSAEVPSGYNVTEVSGLTVSPGFIDLQIAGGGGLLFSSAYTKEDLEKINTAITMSGTTSYLLVLPTNTKEVYSAAIKAVKESNHKALLGLHMEGPFISQAKRGAHVSEYIRKPEPEQLKSLLDEGRGVIKMITVAPELCERDFIKKITAEGIIACAGHSNATFDQALTGIQSGITGITHLFNAMSAFHHREAGLPGAAMHSADVMASIVADGIHVDYKVISLAKRLLKDRLYLISDAVEENRKGAYQHILRGDRYTLEDGTLSGSALTMMKAVANCTRYAGIEPEEALRMATVYPAKLMRLTDRGAIAPGLKADIVAFDREFNIKIVIKEGQKLK